MIAGIEFHDDDDDDDEYLMEDDHRSSDYFPYGNKIVKYFPFFYSCFKF
jgi:hypothetical protein